MQTAEINEMTEVNIATHSMLDPDDLFTKLKGKIPQNIKITFTAACVSGLIAHLYIFTKKLPNHDDIGSLFGTNYGVASGRWLLPSLLKLDGSFSMPWLIGVLSILMIAIAACFIVAVLRIRRPLECVFAASVTAVFPVVTATMAYMFSADVYFLSLALACFAAYIADKYRFGFLIGIVVITLSMGIYQSYFGVAAVVMVGTLIYYILNENRSIKFIVVKAVKFAVTLVVGMILYILIVKLTTRSTALVSYMGISDMGHISASSLPWLLYSTYLEYYHFFIKNTMLVHFSYMKYAFIISIVAAVYLVCFIASRRKLKPKKIAALLIFAILYPLAGNIIFVMVPNSPIHMLMLFGMAGILIAPIALVGYYKELPLETQGNCNSSRRRNIRSICCWIIMGTMALTIYGYLIYDNKAYLKMELSFDQTYSFSTRLLSAIENTDGYRDNTPIVLVGPDSDSAKYAPTPELNDINLTGVLDMNELINSYTYGYFLKEFNGTSNNIYAIGSELSEKYKNYAEVNSMPAYPNSGSIKKIDKYLIVKLK